MKGGHPARAGRARPWDLEALESRQFLSASPQALFKLDSKLPKLPPMVTLAKVAALHAPQVQAPAPGRPPGAGARLNLAFPTTHKSASLTPHTSPSGEAFTPAQIRRAYGLDGVLFGDIAGDGTGQTIAVIGAYHYPTAWQDLQAFSAAFNLPDPPSFLQVAQDGSTNYPPTDPAGAGNPNGTWALEAAMDLQWAHAMAPRANLILVEAKDNNYPNLIVSAVNWARNHPAVSVISMSFGGGEFSGELNYNQYLTTPAGHQGITFVASTGDNGVPGNFPSFSPNVVAVGGTSLTLSDNTYVSETGWYGSGGGVSLYQNKPAYQTPVSQSVARRTIPDISLVGDPNTGVAVYDSWDHPASPWIQLGGTSLSAPLMAGIVAVANQGRALAGKPTLDGAANTLPALYAAGWDCFNDITTGNNGHPAAVGYDLVTGRGSPRVDKLIAQLVGPVPIAGRLYSDNNANARLDPHEPGLPGVALFLDTNGNATRDVGGTLTKSSGTLNAAIPDSAASNTLSSSLTVTDFPGLISSLKLTFSIEHANTSDLVLSLIAPDNTTLTLINRVGGTGNNFTNTTLDDAGFSLLATASAPFSGSFRPANALAALNGKDPNGTWTLKIVDARRGTMGTLLHWSLTLSTPNDPVATTGDEGGYAFTALPGSGTIREVLTAPHAGFIAAVTPTRPLTTATAYGPQNIGLLPTQFTLAGPGDILHLWLDPTGTRLRIGATLSATAPAYDLPLTALPALRVTLAGEGSRVVVNFANGAPFPSPSLTVDGGGVSTGELIVIGPSPGAHFTMTDAAIGPKNGPCVTYGNLSTMTLYSATVFFTGTLDNLNYLNVGAGTSFYWM